MISLSHTLRTSPVKCISSFLLAAFLLLTFKKLVIMETFSDTTIDKYEIKSFMTNQEDFDGCVTDCIGDRIFRDF